jgi:hypothetical protein
MPVILPDRSGPNGGRPDETPARKRRRPPFDKHAGPDNDRYLRRYIVH